MIARSDFGVGASFRKREGYGVLLNPLGTFFSWKAYHMTIPRYVNEVISDVRGIKPGWYAMDDVGNLSTGPFSSKAECLGSITQPTLEPVGSPPK